MYYDYTFQKPILHFKIKMSRIKNLASTRVIAVVRTFQLNATFWGSNVNITAGRILAVRSIPTSHADHAYRLAPKIIGHFPRVN